MKLRTQSAKWLDMR